MILETEETRVFHDLDSAKNLIRDLEATENWTNAEKSSSRSGEVVDCPIIPDMFTNAPMPDVNLNEKNGVTYPSLEGGKVFRISENDREAMAEAMRESRMVVGYKESTPYSEFKPHPLALSALPSLTAQAGYQHSPALVNINGKGSQDAMRPELRSAIINEGLKIMKGTCQVYTCDQMVRFVASKTYVPIKISDLLEGLLSMLKKNYPSFSFETGFINHTFVDFRFSLNDEFLTKKLRNVLEQSGISGNHEPCIRFITSNTGDSGANLYPMLTNGVCFFAIEEPIKMEHLGEASVEKFKQNVEKAYAAFKVLPNRIDSLSRVPINNVKNCYLNVGAAANLPPKSYAESAEFFAQTYQSLVSALDVYFYISENFAEYAYNNKMSPIKQAQYESNLARVFVDQQKILECDSEALIRP